MSGTDWHTVSAIAFTIGIVGGAAAAYVRLTVRSALSEFKAEILNTLNGRYFLRREAELFIAEIERQLSAYRHKVE